MSVPAHALAFYLTGLCAKMVCLPSEVVFNGILHARASAHALALGHDLFFISSVSCARLPDVSRVWTVNRRTFQPMKSSTLFIQ